MSLKLKDRSCRVTDIITLNYTTFSSDSKIMLKEWVPVTTFKIFNFFFKAILQGISTQWTLSNIDNIKYSIVSTSQQ